MIQKEIIENYRKLGSQDFIRNFEIQLMNEIEVDRYLKLYDSEYAEENIEYFEQNYIEIETAFIQKLSRYLSKRFNIMFEYFDHCKKTNKYRDRLGSIAITESVEHNYKMHFLDYRLKKIDDTLRLDKIFNKPQSKKLNPLLIDGQKPNISERYKIANEVSSLYENISIKNISATEKHILLAHILGCSQQVARELFNGTQEKRTPIREGLVNDYLKTFK